MLPDPFDLLDTETARLYRFFGDLHGSDWQLPSRCPGWDRVAMLAHLTGIEDYIRAGLDDTVDQYRRQAGPGTGYQELNEYIVARRRGTAPGTLLEHWHRQTTRLHPRLRERGAEATIATAAGDYPLGRQTHFLACEFAIHADDIAAPVDEDELADRLAWRLEFAVDVVSEYRRQVTITPGDDGFVVAGADGVTAELAAVDLVEACSGRLPAGVIPESLRNELVVLA